MFTGIVQEVGVLSEVRPIDQGLVFVIEAPRTAAGLSLGDSVCTQGVCLTCVERRDARFTVEVSAETLRRTTLGTLKRGDKVNLEPAMRLSDRLGGHLVSGHVDGTGRLLAARDEGASRLFTFSAPADLLRYIVEKGSIAVDGVSLTIAGVTGDGFSVALIPHTLKATTLGAMEIGDEVNLECDVIGKYVARLLRPFQGTPAGTEERA